MSTHHRLVSAVGTLMAASSCFGQSTIRALPDFASAYCIDEYGIQQPKKIEATSLSADGVWIGGRSGCRPNPTQNLGLELASSIVWQSDTSLPIGAAATTPTFVFAVSAASPPNTTSARVVASGNYIGNSSSASLIQLPAQLGIPITLPWTCFYFDPIQMSDDAEFVVGSKKYNFGAICQGSEPTSIVRWNRSTDSFTLIAGSSSTQYIGISASRDTSVIAADRSTAPNFSISPGNGVQVLLVNGTEVPLATVDQFNRALTVLKLHAVSSNGQFATGVVQLDTGASTVQFVAVFDVAGQSARVIDFPIFSVNSTGPAATLRPVTPIAVSDDGTRVLATEQIAAAGPYGVADVGNSWIYATTSSIGWRHVSGWFSQSANASFYSGVQAVPAVGLPWIETLAATGSFSRIAGRFVPTDAVDPSSPHWDSRAFVAEPDIDSVCLADLDNSGFVDTDDFFLFVSQFAGGCLGYQVPAFDQNGDPVCVRSADVDGSGFVDSDDFGAFVALFNAGC